MAPDYKLESWLWLIIDFEWIVQQELITVLCDDSTGCKEAGDNDDFHRTGNEKRLIWVLLTWMGISFEYLY